MFEYSVPFPTSDESPPVSKRKILILIAILIPVTLFAIALISPDEPVFEVVSETDDYELRAYPAFIVAETRVKADFDQAGGDAFRILVDYIQGNNVGGRNLPMTAPVIQQEQGAQDWLFQFVMAKEYLMPMLPRPLDERVALEQEPARLIAARRYGGGWDQSRYRENEQALLDALAEDGLTPIGAPLFARYNAPFVPGFLRRNEVLAVVEPPAPSASPAQTEN